MFLNHILFVRHQNFWFLGPYMYEVFTGRTSCGIRGSDHRCVLVVFVWEVWGTLRLKLGTFTWENGSFLSYMLSSKSILMWQGSLFCCTTKGKEKIWRQRFARYFTVVDVLVAGFVNASLLAMIFCAPNIHLMAHRGNSDRSQWGLWISFHQQTN